MGNQPSGSFIMSFIIEKKEMEYSKTLHSTNQLRILPNEIQKNIIVITLVFLLLKMEFLKKLIVAQQEHVLKIIFH